MKVYVLVADICIGERIVEVYANHEDALKRRKQLIKMDRLKYISVFVREVE